MPVVRTDFPQPATSAGEGLRPEKLWYFQFLVPKGLDTGGRLERTE